MDLFFIGLKNVFRNKRRSALNIVALSIGITLMILFIGWMRGYFTNFYNAIIRFDTGHLQVLHKDYLSLERKLPLDLNVRDYREIRQELMQDERIEEVTGRTNFFTILSTGKKSIRLMGTAIDPIYEKRITIIEKQIVEGSSLDQGAGLLIGKPLALKLGLKPGQSVFISSPDKWGAVNMIEVTVVGIFNYGYPVMDDSLVFIDLQTAASLLGLENEVTRLVIKCKPGVDWNEMIPAVQEKVSAVGCLAYSWERFAQVLVSAMNQDLVTFGLLLLVFFVLIILGILNSMYMSIRERTRELSTIRAIGMRKNKLVRLLLAESVGLALISMAASLVVAAVLAWLLQYVGFDVSAVLDKNVPMPFTERLTADFRWYDFAVGMLIGLASALLGTIFPAVRSTKLNIARSMGTANLV